MTNDLGTGRSAVQHVEVDSLGVAVPFVQYLRPHGTPRDVITHVPASMLAKVQAILDAGYVFECEVLRNDDIVSLTITDRDVGDLACHLVRNGRQVPDEVRTMIEKFDIDKANAQRDRMRE